MHTTHDSSPTPTPLTAAAEATDQVGHRPDPAAVSAAIARRSVATLATVSPAGRPHVAGVLYEQIGSDLVISTLRTSRKARNVAAGGRVGVCIPIRRVPFGPPSTVQFQADAEVLDVDDPFITAAIAGGHLTSITGHGELVLPDSCFVRLTIPQRVLTYGLGMSLWSLIRNPLDAGGVAILGETS